MLFMREKTRMVISLRSQNERRQLGGKTDSCQRFSFYTQTQREGISRTKSRQFRQNISETTTPGFKAAINKYNIKTIRSKIIAPSEGKMEVMRDVSS